MNDRITGSLLLAAAIGILLIYSYGLFFAGSFMALLVLQLTAFVGVAAILGLVGWIGYSIATTAPPPPPEPEVELGGNKEEEDTTTPTAPPAPTPQQSKNKKTANKKPRKREAKPATITVT